MLHNEFCIAMYIHLFSSVTQHKTHLLKPQLSQFNSMLILGNKEGILEENVVICSYLH